MLKENSGPTFNLLPSQCMLLQQDLDLLMLVSSEINATNQVTSTPLHIRIRVITMNLAICFKTLSPYFNGVKETIKVCIKWKSKEKSMLNHNYFL